MIRPNAYGKVLFPEAQLQSRHAELYPKIDELNRAWQEQAYPEPEVVAQYLLTFLKVFRPKDFLGGPHRENLRLTNVLLPPGVQVFADHSLRSVPLAVNRALVAWAEGRIQLKLRDHIPTAFEVLELQAQGQRIVTCLFAPQELTQLVLGERDPFVFVLHDLIHADHFSRDPLLARGQQDFYQECLARYRQGEFATLLKDPQRTEQFHYLIGDMNSHPEHLRATLEHLLSTSNPLQF